MAKDKTNIFKLYENEQDKYVRDPFFDCMPGARDFAEALEQDILNKETPYVLLLEQNYGMGKTFFSTRFTQYLRNKKINAIYFSAWENDYLPDPFLSFSKELQKYFHNITLREKAGKAFAKVTTSTKKLTANLLKATQISMGVNAAAQASITIDNEKIINAVEEVFNDFKEEKDSIQEFKEELSDFINKLPKKKLVLIVDELDRCRPDYAMKVLEIIKHFFDIEGLFIIVPTNQMALETSLEALYGIKVNEKKPDRENYFKKFFNNTKIIPNPNYEKFVKAYIGPESLTVAINSKYILMDDNKFNSFNVLINSLSRYGRSAKLSLRELKPLCKDIIDICNQFHEEIRLEYLAYLICNKEAVKKRLQKGDTWGISLNSEHPYCEDKKYAQNNNSKTKLLNFVTYKDKLNKTEIRQALNQYHRNDSVMNNIAKAFYSDNVNNLTPDFKTFKEIMNFISEKESIITNFPKDKACSQLLNDLFTSLKQILEEKRLEIITFQEKYGSDDDDIKRQARYKEII